MNAEEETINLISEVDVTLNSSTQVSVTAETIEVEVEGDMTVSCENFGVEASGDTTLAGDGGVVLEGKGVGLN